MKAQFESQGIQPLAINPASVASHQRYATGKGFTFPILSDPGGRVVAAYRCQKPDGKGVLRTVYAVGPTGIIVFSGRGHADLQTVLETIQASSQV